MESLQVLATVTVPEDRHQKRFWFCPSMWNRLPEGGRWAEASPVVLQGPCWKLHSCLQQAQASSHRPVATRHHLLFPLGFRQGL